MLKSKMRLSGKKGQIGETMTWVVVTLVIIMVLIISGAIVKFKIIDKPVVRYLSNDVVATKSAIAFFNEDKNFENLEKAIEEEDYTQIKPKIEEFLELISADKQWNFRVFVDGKVEGSSFFSAFFSPILDIESKEDSTVVTSTLDENSRYTYFAFNSGDKIIGLKFDGGKNE